MSEKPPDAHVEEMFSRLNAFEARAESERGTSVSTDEDCDPELSRSIAEMRSNADRRTVVIEYTNWKQIRSTRHIIPMSIRWGATEYHPSEQWLLEAFDRDKGAERTFALRDVHSWRELAKGENK